ncbi:hypothetical protein [Galactobacter sp.]|uniref:hypothetical protein n=1 Tax=Galactobacter sp. TaxID=2676125 RepID=UPI0025C5480B|nr:hypothetical protein [Galactobacter sp.]
MSSTYADPCRKVIFSDRKKAKQAARKQPGSKLHVYRCPHDRGFHLGHLPSAVRTGRVSASHYSRAGGATKTPATKPRINFIGLRIHELDRTGHLDQIGALVAFTIAESQRIQHLNPTWTEAMSSLPVALTNLIYNVPTGWKAPPKVDPSAWWKEKILVALMLNLRSRRWVDFDRSYRSLRTGSRGRELVSR